MSVVHVKPDSVRYFRPPGCETEDPIDCDISKICGENATDPITHDNIRAPFWKTLFSDEHRIDKTPFTQVNNTKQPGRGQCFNDYFVDNGLGGWLDISSTDPMTRSKVVDLITERSEVIIVNGNINSDSKSIASGLFIQITKTDLWKRISSVYVSLHYTAQGVSLKHENEKKIKIFDKEGYFLNEPIMKEIKVLIALMKNKGGDLGKINDIQFIFHINKNNLFS